MGKETPAKSGKGLVGRLRMMEDRATHKSAVSHTFVSHAVSGKSNKASGRVALGLVGRPAWHREETNSKSAQRRSKTGRAVTAIRARMRDPGQKR